TACPARWSGAQALAASACTRTIKPRSCPRTWSRVAWASWPWAPGSLAQRSTVSPCPSHPHPRTR
ncbi:hypothetical protein BGZ59_004760, partial [Podila verticillata]